MNHNINYLENRFLMFDMDNIANQIEESGKKVIRMTLGKSELPLHDSITGAMNNALEDFGISSLVYPSGLPEFKMKLSDFYYRSYGAFINPENIIISPGTSNIFRNLFYLLINEGDEVLLPLPYYSLYKFSALMRNAKIKYYNIDLNTMQIDKSSFLSNFSEKTKAVVINTPGNPLGNIIDEKQMYEIDAMVNGKAVIICDEIYSNVYFEEGLKSATQLKNTKSTFVVTNSFSKAYRMYSRRVGYCIVPDELVEPMTVIQHHTLLTTDPVVQYGAMSALDYDEEVKHLSSLYKKRRDYTIKRLSGLTMVQPLLSHGGFYITLECSEFMHKNNFTDSYELAKDIIYTKYVATVPGSDFGLPNTLRLSFSNEFYNEGIDLLYDYFNGFER